MRTLLWGRLLGLALTLSWPALATSDGGDVARFVGLAGPGQRQAIIALESVQADCGDAECGVFHLDLSRRKFAYGHYRTLAADPKNATYSSQQIYDSYATGLPAAVLSRLQGFRPNQPGASTLPVDTGRSKARDVYFRLNSSAHVRVRLMRLWTAPSMAPFDKLQGDLCLSEAGPICSSCRRVVRWVDGRRHRTWACAGQGSMRVEEARLPCNCSARAVMYGLHVTHLPSGHAVAGSRVLVEPFKLLQLWGDGPDAPLDTSVTFKSGAGPQMGIHAHQLPSGVLVVGSVAHAPALNGTFFPVVAWLPFRPVQLQPARRSR